MEVMEAPRSHAQLVMALLVPCLWMATSSGLIMLNKILLRDLGFSYPIILSTMGQVFSAVTALLVCRVAGFVDAAQPVSTRFYITKLLPIGGLMALTLVTGNAAYLHLTVSFIQMLKSMGPVITMTGLWLASVEVPTRALCASVVAITVGTGIASCGEVNMSFIGLCYMITSSFSEAARLVLTQILLQGLKFHPIEGLMYLAPACLLWLLPAALIWEVPTILATGAFGIVAANPGLFILASGAGFAVTALAFFTIQFCGSLTLKVLGTVKSSLLVVLCVLLLSEVVSLVQGCGYTIAMVGFVFYQYLKMNPPGPRTASDFKVSTSPEAFRVPENESGYSGRAANGLNGGSQRLAGSRGRPGVLLPDKVET